MVAGAVGVVVVSVTVFVTVFVTVAVLAGSEEPEPEQPAAITSAVNAPASINRPERAPTATRGTVVLPVEGSA